MDWIFDNIQIFLVIALAVGSLVKKFLEAKAEEREARRRMDESPEEVFGPEEDWEPQMAPPPLPRPSFPPPLQPQSAGPPPMSRRVNMPPPLRQSEPDTNEVLKRQREMEDRLRQARQQKEARKKQAAAQTAAAIAHRKAAAAPAGLRATLHQRGSLRRAFLLREVLGPPQGLR
jgi:hypothetical protein